MKPGTNRKTRGRILSFLRDCGTDGLTEAGLHTVFRSAGKHGVIDTLDDQIEYLIDKGYVRRDKKKSALDKDEHTFLHIRAKGTDLLEGSIDSDPGVTTIG